MDEINQDKKRIVLAKTHYKFSLEYYYAAKHLIDNKHEIHHPLYFLLTHATELLLKSYINTVVYYPSHTHELIVLAAECKSHGLEIPPKSEEILKLIQSENSKHGFRYFYFLSTGIPEISYFIEFVECLINFVDLRVKDISPDFGTDSALFKFIVGKPVAK